MKRLSRRGCCGDIGHMAGAGGALAALVRACRTVSPRSPTAPDVSVPLKVEPATIRFGASGSETERPVWQAITETFNQKGTGITAEYEPCVSECLDKYAPQYLAGTAPDVFRIDDEPMPFYPAKGMYYWSFGATLLDGRGRWAVNTPETVRAYQWLADLRHRHKVIP